MPEPNDRIRRRSGGGVSILLGIPAVLAAIVCYSGLHQVPEGHIGLYWRGGALVPGFTEPGFHVKLPLITSTANVQVTLQTDTVTDIPCGTSGGTVIYFDKVEVVNRLDKQHAWNTTKWYGVDYDKVWIFDKIHHEINQFCSSHTLQEVYITLFDTLDESLAKSLQADCDKYDTGIDIIAIRVTKPRIPRSVKDNYERIESKKTELMVAEEEQKNVRKQEETLKIQATIQADKEKEVALIRARREAEVAVINAELEARVAIIEAEKQKNVSLIDMETQLAEKRTEQQKADIDVQIYQQHMKAEADATHYTLEQEALAYQKMLTPEYLKMILYKSLSNNTKVYFGEKIPDIFAGLLSQQERDALPL